VVVVCIGDQVENRFAMVHERRMGNGNYEIQ
jgi:hypothetical protein